MDEITNDSIGRTEVAEAADANESVHAAIGAEQSEECSADIAAAEIDVSVNADCAVQTDEESSQKKSKRPLPPKVQKIVDYLNTHEDIRQMVFFLMFSVLCGLSQMIVTYALSAGLKLSSSLTVNFSWFIFKFDTTAEFIGFLVGSIVGQVLTFVLNRKKTFNTPDHVAIRATMYAILAILIILMQTALGGAVTSACYGAVPENEASEFLKLVFNLTGQAVGGVAAVIVNFLGNKFLVMRDWGKKKKTATETETAVSDADNLAQACCDNDEQTEA